MIAAINKVDQTKLSAQERVSLNQLRDMYGTTSWHDLKDSNQAKLALGANGLLAVGLGVVGAGLTATGIGAVVGVPMTMIGTAGAI